MDKSVVAKVHPPCRLLFIVLDISPCLGHISGALCRDVDNYCKQAPSTTCVGENYDYHEKT